MVEQCQLCHEKTAYPIVIIDSHNPVHPAADRQTIKICSICFAGLPDKEREFRHFLANGPKFVGRCTECDYRSVSSDSCDSLAILEAHRKETHHTIATEIHKVEPAA